MKIAIATDAWEPQTNGVVTTLKTTISILQKQGHEVEVLSALDCRSFPIPTYTSIRLALFPYRYIKRKLEVFQPDMIHIATEGTIGWAARRYCIKHNLKFTTAYHTQFPEYVRLRVPIPVKWTYKLMARFHNKAERTMVATQSMENLIKPWIPKLVRWTRGVDTEQFQPYDKNFLDTPRPISVFVGRVAVEKNIEDFLNLELEGSKYVIGDGPDLDSLKSKYPDVHFTGMKKGKELAQHIAAADVFVFPSRTDTFGLVMLEAMACGVPVAAYPVTGPVDVVTQGVTGSLNEDLAQAIKEALQCSTHDCREYALLNTWEHATAQFYSNLEVNQTALDVDSDAQTSSEAS